LIVFETVRGSKRKKRGEIRTELEKKRRRRESEKAGRGGLIYLYRKQSWGDLLKK